MPLATAAWQQEGSGSFLKKRTKKLLLVRALSPPRRVRNVAKVFASFSKKKRFLPDFTYKKGQGKRPWPFLLPGLFY
jgi:hypothetical protein